MNGRIGANGTAGDHGAHTAGTYAAMVLHVFLAAGTYVFGRNGALGVTDPAALTLLRSAGASVLCLALTGWVLPVPRFSLREWIEIALLGALLVPMNQYLFMAGLKDTVPSHPALIYAMTPVGVLILAALLDRRVPPAIWLVGVALALCGVMLVLEPWNDDQALATVRNGDILILIGLLVWVVYTVWAGRIARRSNPLAVTAWSLIAGTVLFLPIGWNGLSHVAFDHITPKTWFGIAWLAVITSTVMMFLWNHLLRRLAPVQVAVCANAQPAATALLSIALAAIGVIPGDHGVGLTFWVGTALVVAGVWIVQRRPAAPKAAPAATPGTAR